MLEPLQNAFKRVFETGRHGEAFRWAERLCERLNQKAVLA
ncbi:hypothetical protein EIB18_07480 [Caulobacter vibrioides]|uniref:Uncharacterized protein n=1 Tax=Caulobacter vibrioides (strain ATCC 19089 / CIP 103742 / CB 15) TaxID=190650 RepID=Q9A8G0_CAUVC|nr:hypothetical protein CC_1394 [Caulobacter vibrioides CB15]AVG21592.1 hypothetical protein CA608_20210 [Caulobacter vibrioides]AVH77124.1 hypothetical protein CA607_20375 [Caulobacter vibrioides]AZH12569.1 hypothetical protein EIB18_07480 [Caulobacter vibrioides]PLR15131.1 hypothetical protein CVUC_03335 [Caulobacter vibrioides]